MTEERPLRLFAAFDVPDDLLEQVDALTEELRRELPDARWAPLANQHVTLRFFGSTPPERLEGLRDLCAAVARTHSPAELRLTELGAFPTARRARVVWVGIEDAAGRATALQEALENGARSLGFAPEERAYTPHLTLARMKRPLTLPVAAGEISFAQLPGFSLDELVVYQSHLSPRGARYEIWERFALG